MSQEELRKDAIQGQIIHVYDGIEEADNALPRWWLVTFFGAIVFSIFYWMAYESMPVADYPGAAFTKARLEALNKGGTVTNKDVVAMLEDAPMLAEGKKIFIRSCAQCHGARGEGKEGPNLTDNFWLYGGNPIEIYNTIANGTKKGMPDWAPKLGKGAVKQVAAYIVTLRNTNVAGKAAQGTEWVPLPEEESAPEGETDEGEEASKDEAPAPEEPATP